MKFSENVALPLIDEEPVVLELKDIGQKYDDGFEAIKDLNLVIKKRPSIGQFRVILGPSGTGKSTVLRFISGLQDPTSGQVLIGGRPLEASDRIGMVFQKYSSLPWLTVRENVELGLKLQGVGEKERWDRTTEMLAMVGLTEHAQKYAQYPSLSGGQLQRVAIARSLLSSPEILLMDEPFGALDVKTRLQMQDLILSIWNKLNEHGNSTTVFVTHDISEAVYLADIVYIMAGHPSKIVDRIPIDFPPNRGHDIKKSSEFIRLVNDIEEKMMALN